MTQRFIHYLIKNQVLLTLVLVALGWLAYQIKSVFVSIFVAYIIMAALLPLVRYLTQKRVPKIIAVAIAYVTVLSLIILLIVPVIPFFTSQVQMLFLGLPAYVDQAAGAFGFHVQSEQIESYIAKEINNIGSNAIVVTSQVFGGLFSTLTIFIVSFYLLLEHDSMRRWVSNLFNKNTGEHVLGTLREVDEKLGAWLRGQAFLSVFIGVLTWIVLTLLGLPNALPLALLAGFLEIIPTLGPIIASIPAILVALTISPTLAIAVIIAYICIQLLENNILVPKIMQRAVGLNPVVVIFAVTAGAKLMGVEGALLSIPFISFLIVLFNSFQGKDY